MHDNNKSDFWLAVAMLIGVPIYYAWPVILVTFILGVIFNVSWWVYPILFVLSVAVTALYKFIINKFKEYKQDDQ